MKPEDKQLLLADLCARLPYGVKVQTPVMNDVITLTCGDISAYFFNPDNKVFLKPYLRPMPSMTEEEKEKLKTLFDAEEVTSDSICYLEGGTLVEYLSRIQYSFCSEIIDFLNAHHFDFRNLIPKGLALEAPEEMYKKEERL